MWEKLETFWLFIPQLFCKLKSWNVCSRFKYVTRFKNVCYSNKFWIFFDKRKLKKILFFCLLHKCFQLKRYVRFWHINKMYTVIYNKLQRRLFQIPVWNIFWVNLLYFYLKWKPLICIDVEYRFSKLNLCFNVLFWIAKLFYIDFSAEYQRWQYFVSFTHFIFVEQIIVTILEGLWNGKCIYLGISLIKTALLNNNNNNKKKTYVTSIKEKLKGTC